MSEGTRIKFVQKEKDTKELTKQEIVSLLLILFGTEVENITTTKNLVIVEKFNTVFQQNPDLLLDGRARECEITHSDGAITDNIDDDENEVPCGIFPLM